MTNAKESRDSIPTWLRTDRWIVVPWQGALNIFTERMGGSHWQRWNPCIQLAMERSKKDWMKTVGKQRDGRNTASPYAYLKFPLLIYISISIPFYFIYLYLSNLITFDFMSPLNWDLQDDHSLLHTNNLCGIDLYSRKVYYLDDPVHLLVSCAKLW